MLRRAVLCSALVLSVTAVACAAADGDNTTHCGTDYCTWWHPSGEVSTDRPVAVGAVRQSDTYLVMVRAAADPGRGFSPSFVHESIPRNGNGKIFAPTDAPHSNTWHGAKEGDGITIEPELGVSMAWSQFEHAVDVDVKILRRDGKSLGPASAVDFRPLGMDLGRPASTADGGIVFRVPAPVAESHGLQFSVEFAHDLHTYRSDGTKYVAAGGSVVGVEPVHSLLIFASPFLPLESLPPTGPGVTRTTMQPGAIRQGDCGASRVLVFPPGVYWVEPRGQSRILLDPATQWVHLAPGAYVKGAIEFTTARPSHTNRVSVCASLALVIPPA